MDYNKECLIAKFEADIKKRSYFNRLLLALDQLGNVAFFNGSQDETISSHLQRKIEKGEANFFERFIARNLNKIEKNHTQKSKGE